MRLTDDMDRMILTAVCDDFVTLECIVDKLFAQPASASNPIEFTDLQRRLLKLIADKLINAYLLHAEPPYMTSIAIGSEGLSTSWFYITRRGGKCLQNSSRKPGRIKRGGAKLPDDSEYTPSVTF